MKEKGLVVMHGKQTVYFLQCQCAVVAPNKMPVLVEYVA